ncbi:YajQ family cyclic di-GMP-binding protein [Patescibacteria group bacterium]|nr:MAG: YajQ family cyclic di-GMP-binding protein [Patescibacteria group bacterium]
MATFSFDIVSEYDKAEINNVFMQAGREIANRYDFKNTPANIDWLGEKTGFTITGNSDMQIEAIVDIVRRSLIGRNQSTKVLDLSKDPITSNLKIVKEVPFVAGLVTDKAKEVSKAVRDAFPKVKPQIQGDAVRVSSSSKDDLQKVMQLLRETEFNFPLSFTNYR